MRTSRHSRLWLTVVAAALGAGALIGTSAPASQLRAVHACPIGQVADDEDPNWQCQPDCPPGMLIDGETGVCVAAPGMPPPALPESAPQQLPQM